MKLKHKIIIYLCIICFGSNAIPAEDIVVLPEHQVSAKPAGYLGLSIVFPSNSKKTRTIYISKIAPNGPAEKAGIKPGDQILSIDGKSVSDMTNKNIAELLTKESGETIIFTLKTPKDTDSRVITIILEKAKH